VVTTTTTATATAETARLQHHTPVGRIDGEDFTAARVVETEEMGLMVVATLALPLQVQFSSELGIETNCGAWVAQRQKRIVR